MLRPRIGAIYKLNGEYVRILYFLSGDCSAISTLQGDFRAPVYDKDLEILDKQEVKQALRQAKQRGMV